MSNEEETSSISPTVLQVFDKFVAAMRDDSKIEDGAIVRLDALIRQGKIPKPEEIKVALFDPPSDGET